jgi:hypothetical protein
MSARATTNICLSVPSCLKELTHANMKRQLLGVYPILGSIRSIVGLKKPGPYPVLDRLKSMPVNAHLPVQTEAPQSSVKQNDTPFLMALSDADFMSRFQGAASHA